MDLNKNLLFVSNLESDSITVISMDNYDIVETIHCTRISYKGKDINMMEKRFISAQLLGKR